MVYVADAIAACRSMQHSGIYFPELVHPLPPLLCEELEFGRLALIRIDIVGPMDLEVGVQLLMTIASGQDSGPQVRKMCMVVDGYPRLSFRRIGGHCSKVNRMLLLTVNDHDLVALSIGRV